ncbi:MAG TPA: tripartite tricarboxylate transporter substrate-binding protein [Burkholderiaceae bacterium]|nr:tripartite tricarboxylate transporter substrate-binding protein [Burkholderiaceae bacterium]
MKRRRLLLAAGSAALTAPFATLTRAQDKPVIRILVGLPAGGGTDAIARYIAERLREELGQPIIVDNKVGVGGRLAANALLDAAPDGLTYMIAPNATPTFQMLVFGHQLKWNIVRDFAAVAALTSYPLGMAVSPNIGVNNAREFIEWAKANPKEASFGTPGLGGQNHFLGVHFAKAAGIDLRVVPYKGTPPLISDLLGGHVPAAVTLMDEMLKHHRAGAVRVIGVFTEKRSELMPDIPTMAEQGIKVTSGEGWTGMWAPAKTPPAELKRMQRALQKILAARETREFMTTRLVVVPHFRDAQQMVELQRAELATWEPIIKASGFKPE